MVDKVIYKKYNNISIFEPNIDMHINYENDKYFSINAYMVGTTFICFNTNVYETAEKSVYKI